MIHDKDTSMISRAKDTLLEIAPNLSRADKADAAKEYGIHKATVLRYLKGDVRDIGTATNLIGFFRKRIVQREKELAA